MMEKLRKTERSRFARDVENEEKYGSTKELGTKIFCDGVKRLGDLESVEIRCDIDEVEAQKLILTNVKKNEEKQ